MLFEHPSLSCNSTAIRILTLLPGSFEDDIKCHLFESLQPHETSFEALSYTWGTSQCRIPISVNGLSLHVTSNLEIALRYLRHQAEARNLWIDAICINQGNNAEKSTQVGRMREIYAGAETVVIWLGEDADGASTVMAHLYQLWILEGCPSCIVGAGSRKKSISAGWEQGYLEPGSPQANARDWMNSDPAVSTAMDAFFCRPWWSRAWVVQEISQARKATLLCGPHSLSWTSLESFFAKRHENTVIFLLLPQLNHPRILNFNKASQLVISRISNLDDDIGIKTTLFSNLSYLSHTEATDPRDKVYCLLGLKTNMNHLIIPDYSKSVHAVYLDAAKAILAFDSYGHIDSIFNHALKRPEGQFTLNLICKVNRMGSSTSNFQLPSWVPDFSYPDIPWDLVKSYDRVQAFNTAGRFCTIPYPPVVEAPSTLVISCHFWDAIAEISEPLSYSSLQTNNWEQILRSWIPRDLGNMKYPTGETAEDAFWRTLVQDRPSSEQTIRLHEADKLRYRAEFRTWAGSSKSTAIDVEEDRPLRFQTTLDSEDLSTTTNEARRRPVRYPSSTRKQGSTASPNTDSHGPIPFRHLLPRLAGWRACYTPKGYFGTVPATVRSGDLIIVARGACVPLVVRKAVDESVNKYCLVGTAYVHGIMDGEVVERFGRKCEEVVRLV